MHTLVYCTGYVKLRIEKNVFELSSILDTYDVSIYVTVTERLGIVGFEDNISFILSAQTLLRKSDIGK